MEFEWDLMAFNGNLMEFEWDLRGLSWKYLGIQVTCDGK